MNVYLIGMIVAMIVFVIIGIVISRKIKNVEDFYVAGRRAPTVLIAGSLIASYASTGLFMGDAAQGYEGIMFSVIILTTMQCAGYVIGAVFFGRYLRRSHVLTIPEYFGKRFDSKPVRTLSAITAIVTMTVYLLSVTQGIGTLMQAVTGVDYRICIIVAAIVFTLISVLSGSRGVLITDTLMAAVFTIAMLVGVAFIAKNTGGWFGSIKALASDPATTDILSWHGKMGVLYNTNGENLLWGLNFGIVWMSVCMVGPWQASRYQMAKDEHTVIKSSYWAAIGIFIVEFFAIVGAVMVRRAAPDLPDSSHVLIWGAMNLMPKIVGIILLTGILSAGISSATTFQSLIGASFANDVFHREQNLDPAMELKQHSRSIRIGRIAMIVAAAVVLAISISNPPAIFVIMYLGGAMVGSAWMPTALASVFSKRLTKTGAFCGMLAGFIGCFGMKLFTNFAGISLPAYLDPSIIGIVLNILGMVIGSALTKVTQQEKDNRAALFVIPEEEKNPVEIRKTLRATKLAIFIGVGITVVILLLLVIPYLSGKSGL